MSSETIKALLMITLFCGLLALLHLPQLINSQAVERWLERPFRSHMRRSVTLPDPGWARQALMGFGFTTGVSPCVTERARSRQDMP